MIDVEYHGFLGRIGIEDCGDEILELDATVKPVKILDKILPLQPAVKTRKAICA